MRPITTNKRLTINTQTIRTLTATDLRLAHGGLPAYSFDICGTSQTGSCQSVGCSSGLPCTNSTVGC